MNAAGVSSRIGAAIAILTALLSLPFPLAAQVAAQPDAQERGRSGEWTQPAAARPDPELDRLRSRIEERWRVVPLQEGFLLTPRRPGQDVRGVEIRTDRLAIDGRPVSGFELRERLGADADAVLALSYLSAAQRQQLFFPVAAPPEIPRGEPTAPAAPDDAPAMRRQGTRFRLGSHVLVRENERVEEAVAVFGSVTVEGQVDKDVVAVFGSVRLGPRAHVRGDITAVGGRIDIDPSAQLHGRTTEVGLAVPPFAVRWPDLAGWRLGPANKEWAGFVAAATLVRMAVIAILAVLILVIARDSVVGAGREVSGSFWLALIVGVALQLLLFPVLLGITGVLVVSVIGIPLLALLPLLLLATGVVWLTGFVAAAHTIGCGVLRRDEAGASVFALVIGLALVWVVTLAARAWWWSSGEFGVAVALLSVTGLMIEGAVWSAGLGAVFLFWLNTRGRREVAPGPVVSPPPAAPISA
jgi:hypothetical protein